MQRSQLYKVSQFLSLRGPGGQLCHVWVLLLLLGLRRLGLGRLGSRNVWQAGSGRTDVKELLVELLLLLQLKLLAKRIEFCFKFIFVKLLTI